MIRAETRLAAHRRVPFRSTDNTAASKMRPRREVHALPPPLRVRHAARSRDRVRARSCWRRRDSESQPPAFVSLRRHLQHRAAAVTQGVELIAGQCRADESGRKRHGRLAGRRGRRRWRGSAPPEHGQYVCSRGDRASRRQRCRAEPLEFSAGALTELPASYSHRGFEVRILLRLSAADFWLGTSACARNLQIHYTPQASSSPCDSGKKNATY